MAKKQKNIIVVPDVKLPVAELPFGVITGKGTPGYKGVGLYYSVSLLHTKKSAKILLDQVMDFWDENKPKRGGKKPSNFKNLVRDADNAYGISYFKTQTKFDDGEGNVKIPLVDGAKNPLDLETYGEFGKGSTGRVSITFAIHGDDRDAGVSMYLKAVSLKSFAPNTNTNAVEDFPDDGEFEKKKPKKDKKKKKKK